MFNLFVTIVSLVSFVHLGVEATTSPALSRTKNPSSCYTLAIVPDSSMITAACSADGTFTATVNDPISTDSVYFYLTDTNATTLVMPGTYSAVNNNFSATFVGLVATTYTLTAVVQDSLGNCCLTNCSPVSLVPAICDCGDLNVIGIFDASASNEDYTLYAGYPVLQTSYPVTTPFQLHYGWYAENTPVRAGAVITLPSIFLNPSLVGVGPNATLCAEPCCSTIGAAPAVRSSFPGFSLVSATAIPPTSPFACDGSIAASVQNPSLPVIYYLNSLGDEETCVTLYDNVGKGVTFTNLPVGTYVLNSATINESHPCVSYSTGISVTAQPNSTAQVQICAATNSCGNYVDLVAIPSSSNTAPATSCFLQNFVWTFSPDNVQPPCFVGRGPTVSVTVPGYYTVTASSPTNSVNCTPNPCLSSDPFLVTLTACNTDCSSTPPTVSGQDLCICTGADLTLEFSSVSATSSTGQLFVAGPGCFSYTSPISLDGSPVIVPVTSFATATNAGCYYALVVDTNGCVGSNYNEPNRVIVIPCCPLDS